MNRNLSSICAPNTRDNCVRLCAALLLWDSSPFGEHFSSQSLLESILSLGACWKARLATSFFERTQTPYTSPIVSQSQSGQLHAAERTAWPTPRTADPFQADSGSQARNDRAQARGARSVASLVPGSPGTALPCPAFTSPVYGDLTRSTRVIDGPTGSHQTTTQDLE